MSDIVEGIADKKPVGRPRKTPPTITDQITAGGSVLRMTSEGGSWSTPSGVEFTKEQPYQFVPVEEIEPLLKSGRFRRAEAEEVRDFYNIEL